MFKGVENEPDSKLEELIKNQASLEDLFEDPLYLDEVTYQNPELFQYLANDQIITKLFNYIYTPKTNKNKNFQKLSKYSFYAYSTIANCSSEITSLIIKNPNHLKKLFSLINKNDEESITSRGYFQTIIKNMLSDLNPHLNQFIKVLKINPELYIFPLIKNLTKANSEIIKDILGTNEKKIKKLQLCVFEFLLFFYLNEQFEDREDIEDIFENIIDIFHFLNVQEDLIYKYKLKYEYTLYSDEYVNKKKYSEQIYFLKLALLRYIAITEQIKQCKNPEKFLLSYRDFKKSKKLFFYLKELLEFFAVLSKNKEFFQTANFEFYQNLLSVIKEFPYKDIFHKLIFQILTNSKSFINKNKKTLTLLTDFIQTQQNLLNFPSQKKKTSQNKISLHNIFTLLQQINLENIPNTEKRENLQIYRDLLSTLFTKLCFTEEQNEFSDVEEHSDVELVLKKDFHLYKKNKNRRSIPNDKRFHYEDDIMEPELISNPEVKRINNEIFESKNDIGRECLDSDFSDFENMVEKNPLTVLNDFKDRSLLENSERIRNELFSPNVSNFEESKVGKSSLFGGDMLSSDEKGDREKEN